MEQLKKTQEAKQSEPSDVEARILAAKPDEFDIVGIVHDTAVLISEIIDRIGERGRRLFQSLPEDKDNVLTDHLVKVKEGSQVVARLSRAIWTYEPVRVKINESVHDVVRKSMGQVAPEDVELYREYYKFWRANFAEPFMEHNGVTPKNVMDKINDEAFKNYMIEQSLLYMQEVMGIKEKYVADLTTEFLIRYLTELGLKDYPWHEILSRRGVAPPKKTKRDILRERKLIKASHETKPLIGSGKKRR